MKKLMFAAAAFAAIALTSCQNDVKADLNDNVDSLTYYLGLGQTDGLKQYMTSQLQVDSTYMDEFIKGMIEGATAERGAKEENYMKGLEVGKQIKDMANNLGKEVYGDDSTKTVNVKNLLAGIIAGLKGNAPMNSDSAYNQFQELLKPIQEANIEKKYGEYKAQNQKFLADNKNKEGVVTLPSGLQYKVITEGTGALPTDSTTVKCQYEGKLIDGTVFDSSYERNEPFEVNMAMPRVIPGWVEALKLMPAGSKWEVYIPYDLAYGTQDMGQIKPFSTLIFTIETLK
ncbi:MAG: FKBP-type peptidyl-prolyl cis-trans isomerase [Bacteroidaceae bacterium]|nr:FKBP-type peptidyl-prolyl cis-trans isomerase [Bacteroidaceae bacterium]MDO4802290.1 FKBP-type peptidyl-prolyl cis-trans isomerase [Prevotellaceae bacterium]